MTRVGETASDQRLHLDHAAIVSTDMHADIAFYSGLGFTLEARYDDWVFMRDPRGKGLALLSPSGDHPPHFALRAETRAEVERLARDHGSNVVEHRDGSVSTYLTDPSNNSVEVIHYPEHGERSDR